ncbi:MAG: ABC transporter permease [Armatimonadota bacterium]
MSFWRLAWRNLTMRKVRTGLTILSIAVAVSVLYTLLSFNKGYSASLKQQLQQMGVHVLVVPPGCPFEAASLLLKGGKPPAYLGESVLQQIEALPGIQIMAPGFMSAVMRDDRTDIYYGMDQRTIQLKNWWKLKSGGQWFTDDQTDGVVLGSDAALVELVISQQTDPFTPGEELWIQELNRPLKVIGILEPTGTQDDGFFYVPMKLAQEIFKQPNKVTTVALRLDDPAQAGVIGEQLQKLEGVEVITMSELLGTQQRMMESAKMLVMAIVFIAIAISAIGVLNTVLMSVFERTREIGVMRATGASKPHIFSLIWLETLLMTAVGGVVGLLFAISGSGLMEKVVVAGLTRIKFMTVNTHSQLASFDPRIVVMTLLFVLGIGLVAGIYPAFRASRQEPIEALRTE